MSGAPSLRRVLLLVAAGLGLAAAGCTAAEEGPSSSGRGGAGGAASPGTGGIGAGGAAAPSPNQGGASGGSPGSGGARAGAGGSAGGSAGSAGASASGGSGGSRNGGRSGADASDVGASTDGTPSSPPPPPPAGAVVWNVDNLASIGGHPTTRAGAPTVTDVPGVGKAVVFDGEDDALFVDAHPARGLSQFTIEVIFRPDAGGAPAQRFFHLEEDAGGRLLWETRLPGGNGFVADIFVQSRAGNVALYAPQKVHPLGEWYNLTLVVDGKQVRSYVNGAEESTANLGFTPHGDGRTAIGVRINRRYYFKGAIRLARFTPRVLTPSEFLPAR